MSSNLLTLDSKGFIRYDGVCLPVRLVDGALEFVVKHPADRARLQCSRVLIPISEFEKLEPAPAPAPCRPAGRMPREPKRRIVTRRNK
jgi:hypothetical protein